jgi:hypothetical protein
VVETSTVTGCMLLRYPHQCLSPQEDKPWVGVEAKLWLAIAAPGDGGPLPASPNIQLSIMLKATGKVNLNTGRATCRGQVYTRPDPHHQSLLILTER